MQTDRQHPPLGTGRAGMRLIVDCPPLPAPAYVDRDIRMERREPGPAEQAR